MSLYSRTIEIECNRGPCPIHEKDKQCNHYLLSFETDTVDDMKRRGIEFYTIGTGDSPNVGELGDIATDPDSEHDFRLVLNFFSTLNTGISVDLCF